MLLTIVKERVGVFYDEPIKNAEIKSMMLAAGQYFKGAGWDVSSQLDALDEFESELEGYETELKDLENIPEPTPEELEAVGTLETLILTKELEIETALKKLALWIEAVVLYIKMAQTTDADSLFNHPVLTSFIAQARGE